MQFKSVQILKLGLKSLLLQKMRSILAALGIFIGTTTVIWLVAMGEGVSYQAQQQIMELGATNIILRSIEPVADDTTTNQRVKTFGLLRADYQRILSNTPTITQAVPIRELKRQMMFKGRKVDSMMIGCTPKHQELNRLEIMRGRWFNSHDEGENVIVLADGTANRLFPSEDPIGREIQVESDVYTVIGQTKPRQASAAIGGSLDAREYTYDSYIPLSTLRSRVGDMVMTRSDGFNLKGEVVELTQITLSVADLDQVDATAAVVNTLLKKYHDKEDYAVIVPKDLLRQAERTKAMFNSLLVIIAGISLLVGGIGIMNIMLATVTERTREIGIRRALGAKRADIISQFLAETLVLTGTGGVLGVLFGVMCGPVFHGVRTTLNYFSPDLLPVSVQTLEPRIATWSILMSLFISIGVGLIFGLYPARRAAQMNPIEALRHE